MMPQERLFFGTNLGSNRPVSPRQRALFARLYVGLGYVTKPTDEGRLTGRTGFSRGGTEEVPSTDADSPRFEVNFQGQRPVTMVVNIHSVVGPSEPFLGPSAVVG